MGKASLFWGFVLGASTAFASSYLFVTKKSRDEERKKKKGLSSSYSAVSGVEHVSFLTEIIHQLWKHINVAGSNMIKEIMEPKFKTMMPGPLASLHFTKLDLGPTPMRMDNIVVHEIKDGCVQFDMDLLWKADCDIQMKADYGVKLGVKSIGLDGRMSILLKPLTDELPIVSAVQYTFINTPELKLEFTGLAQVADLKVIDSTVKQIISETMESMVVLPIRMLYRMDYDCDIREIYRPPIGIVRLTAMKGRGFIIEKRLLAPDDIPDVYLNVTMAGKKWRTSVIMDSLEPEWNETSDFLLSDYDQTVHIHAWDQDLGPLDPDDDLGMAKLTIGEIMLAGKTKEVELETEDGKRTGAFVTFHCEILPFTENLENIAADTNEEHYCGLVSIIVSKAMNIPVEEELAASFVKVGFGNSSFVTSAIKSSPGIDALNPVYDTYFDVPLTPAIVRNNSDVVFTLMNGTSILGSGKVKFSLLKERMQVSGQLPIGTDGCTLDVEVKLRGLGPPPETSAALSRSSVPEVDGVSEGIGKVQLTVVSGRGYQVQKRFMRKDDIPDLYAKITYK